MGCPKKCDVEDSCPKKHNNNNCNCVFIILILYILLAIIIGGSMIY